MVHLDLILQVEQWIGKLDNVLIMILDLDHGM